MGTPVWIGLAGEQLSREEAELLTRYEPSGIILFSRNIKSWQQCAELTRSIVRQYRFSRPFIGIDQEGGRVVRTAALGLALPAAAQLGALYRQDPQLAASLIRQHAAIAARSVELLGCNLIFAPVLDLQSKHEASNAMLGRTWSSQAKQVCDLAGLWQKNLHASQVFSCIKHFPGLARANKDLHLHSARIDSSLEELLDEDLLPFFELSAKSPMLMLGHVLAGCLDPQYPVSLSAAWMEFLRVRVGFKGVVCSDDYNMQAIADNFSTVEIAKRAWEIGVDMPMFCHDYGDFAELQHVWQQLPAYRQKDTAKRVGKLQRRIPPECYCDQASMDEICRRAEALMRRFEPLQGGESSSPVNSY